MNRKLTLIDLVTIVVIFCIMIVIVDSDKNTIPRPVVTIQDNSKLNYDNWVVSLFNKFDGAYNPLVESVKETLLDPSSFRHIETSYIRLSAAVALFLLARLPFTILYLALLSQNDL